MSISQKEIFLHYKGVILYDKIGSLISELKEKMFERHIKQAIYKRVLMVMIEALENIFKYNDRFEGAKELEDKYLPEILIAKISDGFTITVSNPVRTEDVETLEGKLKEINSLDRQGVKQKYKQIITNGQFSEKGGAGLGIVEMAKITDAPLDFNFSAINKNFKHYRLTLKIVYN